MRSVDPELERVLVLRYTLVQPNPHKTAVLKNHIYAAVLGGGGPGMVTTELRAVVGVRWTYFVIC